MLLNWKIITDMKELPPELTPSILIHLESIYYLKKNPEVEQLRICFPNKGFQGLL